MRRRAGVHEEQTSPYRGRLADIIVYRCGLADRTQEEPLEYTLHTVKNVLASILEQFEPSDRTRILLQGKGNYRDRVATIQPYKGNRDPSKRPVYFDEIRQYLSEYHGAELIHGMETDDAIGIEQWSNKDRSTCIVSIDKDLDCIPGYHYNWVKGEHYYVDLDTANRKFWTQVLTGDTTDNIQGIPKVGPKTAEKLLAGKGDWASMGVAVKDAYRAKFGSQAELHFRETATLIWIQREHMINFDGSVIGSESNEGEEGIAAEGEDEDSSVQELPAVVNE